LLTFVVVFIVQLHLERVLGLNVSSNVALATDPNSGTIAYPAGLVTSSEFYGHQNNF
jgi:hypothetical protein